MKDLTQGKESRLILQFAVPMLLGNLLQQMYNIIDSIIVGNYLGKSAVAAVAASFPIIFLLISLVIGFASGGTIIISQYFGAKDMQKVRRAIDTILIFLFFASLAVTGLGLLLSTFIFEITGLPAEVIPEAKTYIYIYFGGIITMFGFNATSAILRGLGDSKTPLYFLIVSTFLNIGLDFLFIVYLNTGVGGAALATVISQGLAFIAAILYLNKRHEVLKFSLRNLTFDREIFRKSIRIGLPSGLQQTFVALGSIALFGIVNEFGTNTVAAFGIASRIDSFALIPAMNFSIALTTFVGQNTGAGLTERIRKGYHATLLMNTIISATVSLVVIFFGHWLVSVFIDDPKVIETGHQYLIIVGAFYIIFSAMFVTNGLFRGTGDTIAPMLITLCSLWVFRIPVSYFLSREMGTDGIWWGIPIAWAIGLIISYGYYLSGRWKNKSVVKPALEPAEDNTTNL